jgi:hypothetical protein
VWSVKREPQRSLTIAIPEGPGRLVPGLGGPVGCLHFSRFLIEVSTYDVFPVGE